jgi:DNA-directed RNA polymerase specialized sigma24 family protein
VTSQADPTSPPGPPQPPRVLDDRAAFAELFDAHAQHLFDYCYTLLGDRRRAANATQMTLIAAHSLAARLKDTRRMRAWVLALGRWECLGGGQGHAGPRQSDAASPDGIADLAAALAFVDETDDDVDAETGELTLSDIEAASRRSIRSILLALPREGREVLDLTYRHDVSVTDLAAVLGLSAASVPGMLAAARAKFDTKAGQTAAAGPGSLDVRADQLSHLRLASLPASVWRRTARVVMDPRFRSYRMAVSAHAEHLGPDGFPVQAAAAPSGRKLLMASALMAGLLLAPAAAGGAVYAAFSTLAHAASHQHSVVVTPSGQGAGGLSTGGSAGNGRSQGGAKRSGSKAKANRAGGAPSNRPLPSTSRPVHHKPSASPKPTSRYSSPSSPWPSQSPTSPGSPTPTPTSSPSPSPSAA